MLHRTTSTSTWWQGRWTTWQRGWLAEWNSTLGRYLLMLAALCALGCAYLWQASDLSQLHRKILNLEWQAANLEKENMRLAQQSAQWNTPSYIEERMRKEGFVDPQSIVYARPLAAVTQATPDDVDQHIAQSQAPGSP